MSPWINPEFRARSLASSPPRQITGNVEPIDAQARDVTPAKRATSDKQHFALCAVLAIPVAAIIAFYVAGDMRLCAAACLVGMAIGLIGLYMQDGAI